jgi:hypothetical protein
MRRVFIVQPNQEGWRVLSEGLVLEFASGARAEAAARRLAREHAETGACAEVRIVLRDGALAGASLYEKGRGLAPAV